MMLNMEFEEFRRHNLRWFDPWFFKDELEILDLEPNSPEAVKVAKDLDLLGYRFGLNHKIVERIRSRLLNIYQYERRVPRVLDLCGGYGGFARYLMRWSKRAAIPLNLTVLDISSSIIEAALQASEQNNIQWQVGDATALDYKEREFDLALNIQSLHHFDPDSSVKLLREANRVATSLFVFDVRRTPFGFIFVQLLRPFFCPELIHDGQISYRRAYTKKEIIFLIEKAGINATVKHFLPIGLSIESGI